MNHSAPPPEGVTTPPVITQTAEGGGIVLACECGWLRWYPSAATSSGFATAHAKTCKGAAKKSEAPAPKRPRSTRWNDREGATWIDKL